MAKMKCGIAAVQALRAAGVSRIFGLMRSSVGRSTVAGATSGWPPRGGMAASISVWSRSRGICTTTGPRRPEFAVR